MLLEEWLALWVRMYVEPKRLAESTKAMYRYACGAVPEQLRKTPLDQLHPLMIHAWMLSVSERTPRAAQIYHGMMAQALRIAAKMGFCRENIMDPELVPEPYHEPRKAVILNGDLLRAYMEQAATSSAAPVLMMCCCGLRRGEALGMRWDCVNLDLQIMDVVGQRRNGRYYPLKTRASQRRIKMPSQLVNVLEVWPRTSPYCYAGAERKAYAEHARVLASIGAPAVTLHGLRHSVATLAAADGQPIKLLQGALGHANYHITADLYADHLPDVATVISAVF